MEDKVLESCERLAKVELAIETLVKQQEDIKTLATSVQELALSMRDVITQMGSMNKRLDYIEDNRKSKRFFVWATLIGGALGAIVARVMTDVLAVIK